MGDLSGWDVSEVVQNNNMWAGSAMENIDSKKPCTDGGVSTGDLTWPDCQAGHGDGDGATPGPFQSYDDLKSAVDNCLNLVPSGDNCCGGGADCGAAGSSEMPDWDVSLVTSMEDLFRDRTEFDQDLSRWNTGSVTSMVYMFYEASSFNQDLSSWNTGSVTSMVYMFYGASSFNQDLNSWNTESVTDMSYMFSGATSFDQDLSGWNTGSVINMNYMFLGASSFNQDLNSWNTGSVMDMVRMFEGASSFNQDLSGWDTGEVYICTDIFADSGLENLQDKWPANLPAVCLPGV